ncbi:cytochrome C [Desulfovibrio sp. OttesenSCG-928-F20]|nr:cytochrome C [Desulfovibrio sp. OttesenSCG-928-F20]
MKALWTLCLLACLLVVPCRALAAENAFVGAGACESCHPDQFTNFNHNSRKVHSWRSIEKMSPKLTADEIKECYACHTTGYGQPGGFTSFAETPHLANVSCEACHGPGALHVESGDIADIRNTPDVESCTVCHNAQRVENFNFKPMLYHGGH